MKDIKTLITASAIALMIGVSAPAFAGAQKADEGKKTEKNHDHKDGDHKDDKKHEGHKDGDDHDHEHKEGEKAHDADEKNAGKSH